MSEFSSIKQILDEFGKYTGMTMGTSMHPLIYQQRDNIIVVKTTERLKKYDVPVYVLPSGKYVMHRIIEVHDDHYVIMGDNLKEREIVTDDMICGKLVGYYRKGKRYIDCENNKAYKLFSRVWVALIPIRPFLIFVDRGINWIRRHIFKKNV